ncbi:hypothetical protein ACIQW5_24505 [Methylorubrum thiocyanatum]
MARFEELAEASTTDVSRSAEKLRWRESVTAAIALSVATNKHKSENA